MTIRKLSLIIVSLILLLTEAESKSIVKYFQFSVAPQGVVYYRINVPRGAKEIKAVVSFYTNDVNIKILGPTGVVLCQSSTLSLTNKEEQLTCIVAVGESSDQAPGQWQIIVNGAVRGPEAARVKNISGSLTVYIEVPETRVFSKMKKKKDTTSVLFEHTLPFTINSNEPYSFELIVPSEAKELRIKVLDNSDAVNIKLLGPAGDVLCAKTILPASIQFEDTLLCRAFVVHNAKQHGGIWHVIIEKEENSRPVSSHGSVSGQLKIVMLKK